MPPFGGSGSGSAREEGGNILAEWDMDWGGMGGAFDALLGRYGEMFDIGLENMRRQQPRESQAFDLWKQGKESDLDDAFFAREMGKKQWADYMSQMFAAKKAREEAAAAADYDRRARANDAARGIAPAGAYGGESAHQSGAQLDAYGTDIGGGYTLAPGGKIATYDPPPQQPVGWGSGTGGGGVSQNVNVAAPPSSGAAFNALASRGGGMSAAPSFAPISIPEFGESSLERRRR